MHLPNCALRGVQTIRFSVRPASKGEGEGHRARFDGTSVVKWPANEGTRLVRRRVPPVMLCVHRVLTGACDATISFKIGQMRVRHVHRMFHIRQKSYKKKIKK
ncbi:hypothetical protein EVAR_4448_1 [Eumeta japonica]|uniref:Uncharacterized protein n=1 Tax=Eumeta variegata TaxID=151549 RepID=A0A4C1SYM3_EUMVA|nr:hypothetical protein EVAR_4448_1 [Eumeta japonica]